MLRLDPETLYTREGLRELLRPLGVDADVLLARIRPRRVVRGLYLGGDLLDAYRRAPELARGVITAPEGSALAGSMQRLTRATAKGGKRRGRPRNGDGARVLDGPGAALMAEFADPARN